MLAGLLLLGLGIGLGLEERVVVERIRGDELLQRHVGLELGIAALERQMLLDDGREKGLVFSHKISRSRPEGRSVKRQCSRNVRERPHTCVADIPVTLSPWLLRKSPMPRPWRVSATLRRRSA